MRCPELLVLNDNSDGDIEMVEVPGNLFSPVPDNNDNIPDPVFYECIDHILNDRPVCHRNQCLWPAMGERPDPLALACCKNNCLHLSPTGYTNFHR